MAETLHLPQTTNRKLIYESLYPQIEALVEGGQRDVRGVAAGLQVQDVSTGGGVQEGCKELSRNRIAGTAGDNLAVAGGRSAAPPRHDRAGRRLHEWARPCQAGLSHDCGAGHAAGAVVGRAL